MDDREISPKHGILDVSICDLAFCVILKARTIQVPLRSPVAESRGLVLVPYTEAPSTHGCTCFPSLTNQLRVPRVKFSNLLSTNI